MNIVIELKTRWDSRVKVEREVKIDDKYDKDKMFRLLGGTMSALIKEVEADPAYNPVDKSKPCCDKFSDWFGKLEDKATVKSCPFCGTEITASRNGK